MGVMAPAYREPVPTLPADLWPPEAEECFQEVLVALKAGTLTRERFSQLVPDPFDFSRRSLGEPYQMPPMWTHFVRDRCIREVGFAVITQGYLDSLARLLAGRRVVEVCAGMGAFQPLMRARGIDWTSTDKEPWDGSQATPMEALEAIWHFQPDVVFASWVDLGSSLDEHIARLRPAVFINEDCTGSESFGWGDTAGYTVVRPPDWFEDVPHWSGLHDHTVLTVPVGSVSPFGG